MKGIFQQMQEGKVFEGGKFTQKDFDDLSNSLKIAAEKDSEYKTNRLKEMESNRKAIFKRSKELNKEIPLELAYHCYLSYGKTYVGSEFLEKYKEWLD